MDSDFADYLAYTCFSENLVPQFEDLVLTIPQLQSITYIDASVYFEELGMEIEDVDNGLSILSYATNLETLIVDGMGDVDLSFIANNTKLMEISAMDTNISDFSPIASSTSLTTLDLSNANISNSDLEIIAQNDTIPQLFIEMKKKKNYVLSIDLILLLLFHQLGDDKYI